jgi:Family of unknown function (DUF6535)
MIYQTQMMRNDTLPPYDYEPFTPSPQDILANQFFSASLMLILFVALFSMFVKGWPRAFGRGLAAISTPRRRALVREYRYPGRKPGRVSVMVTIFLLLTYSSVILFLYRLALFVGSNYTLIMEFVFFLCFLLYIIPFLIATSDGSASSQAFRRLHSVLLKDANLWRRCLIRTSNTNYPQYIRALFYYFARMAHWRPFCEADFNHKGDAASLEMQVIDISSAIIDKLHRSSYGKSVSREFFQSLVLAGDPAHLRDSEYTREVLGGWAPRSDEMTPEAVRAIGVLICCTKSISSSVGLIDNLYLPVLMGSSGPWDRLLACLIQSQLPHNNKRARSLPLTHIGALAAINEMRVTPKRVLLVVRFLGSRVLPHAEPETKAGAVRIFSALLSRFRPARSSSTPDQLVHTILHAFAVIHDVPLPEDHRGSPLSVLPSLPYLAYNPHFLSLVITQWCSETRFCLRAYQEFARTLIEWLWRRSAYTEVDSQILRGVPLSQVEEYALNLPSDSSNNLIWASLLLEALISESGRPRSDFPALNEEFELEDILIIYDSYLIQCNAMPSLPMQSLLRLRNTGIGMPKLTAEIHYPWLVLHAYTLMRKCVPRKLIPTLEWSDTPALNMIACNRLKYYDSYDSFLFLEPPFFFFFFFLNPFLSC